MFLVLLITVTVRTYWPPHKYYLLITQMSLDVFEGAIGISIAFSDAHLVYESKMNKIKNKICGIKMRDFNMTVE